MKLDTKIAPGRGKPRLSNGRRSWKRRDYPYHCIQFPKIGLGFVCRVVSVIKRIDLK